MRRVYHSRGQAWGIAITGVVGGALIVTTPLGGDHQASWGLWVGLSVGGVACAAICLRVAMNGVYPSDTGLKIVNPLRSVFVPWDQINRFTVKTWGIFPLMGHALLKDGSAIRIFGIQPPNVVFRPNNRSAERVIGELNYLLLRKRNEHL